MAHDTNHTVEFMDAEDVIIFEVVVLKARSFAGAIQLAQLDAEIMEIDLAATKSVSVKESE